MLRILKWLFAVLLLVGVVLDFHLAGQVKRIEGFAGGIGVTSHAR